MKKSYDYYTVRYGSLGSKWAFTWPVGNTLYVDCKGKDMADKVAHIIAGSLKRNDNKLDNLCRANIGRLVNSNNEN